MNKIENNMYYQTNIKTSRNKDINFLQLSYGNFVSLDDYILLKKENQQLKEKQQKLIDYLKEKINITDDFSEELEDEFYIGKTKAYKEILSKIEKR